MPTSSVEASYGAGTFPQSCVLLLSSTPAGSVYLKERLVVENWGDCSDHFAGGFNSNFQFPAVVSGEGEDAAGRQYSRKGSTKRRFERYADSQPRTADK